MEGEVRHSGNEHMACKQKGATHLTGEEHAGGLGVGFCLECLPASERKVTPQEREKESGGLSLQAHTHWGLVLA